MSLSSLIEIAKSIEAKAKHAEAINHAQLLKRSEREYRKLSVEMQQRVVVVLRYLHGKNWQPIIFHGSRTKEEQAKKVASGHSWTMHSLHVHGEQQRKSQGAKAYTGAAYMLGQHGAYIINGEAADIVDIRWLWEGPCHNLNHPFWNDLGVAAKMAGLVWGGLWSGKSRDVAHVELQKYKAISDTRNPVA
ncbi:hypothetical protein J2R76_000130 [Bradyrhizobium sp. USDA 4532]|uniref:hypothetical protein n=1 Tax=unclassified Bradyrhizobium TaxID=2631580 RepID=UPI00209F2C85|nr:MULTISPECIES: hypothetical protein [unclassified Bradyrhizobium]MCP1831702.1 hypothetical protein [Bradyrhizobium sp. USDA 4545]MCP1916539.1 hypothetical protein [Bradyrhizobium sp. USDA 4532]